MNTVPGWVTAMLSVYPGSEKPMALPSPVTPPPNVESISKATRIVEKFGLFSDDELVICGPDGSPYPRMLPIPLFTRVMMLAYDAGVLLVSIMSWLVMSNADPALVTDTLLGRNTMADVCRGSVVSPIASVPADTLT